MKKKKHVEIKSDHYASAWVTIFSIFLFFVSFFTCYFVGTQDIASAFIRSVVVLIFANIIGRLLVMMWHFAIPKQQWALIVHGPPPVDSRSTRIIKERERLISEEELRKMVLFKEEAATG
jgi:hypothetical protein